MSSKVISRRGFLQKSAIAAGTALIAPSAIAQSDNKRKIKKLKPTKQPNVLLIMTDQHRADCIGYMGNKIIKTPHIDSLAKDGVCFTTGYSSVPSCTPARTGLLTGLSPWHHGMLGYSRVALKYKYEMPQMLKEAGYYTFGIGKMHWFPQKTLHGFHATLVDESGRREQPGFISDYHDWFNLNAPGMDPNKTGIGWNEHRSGVYQLDEKLHPTTWTGKTAVNLIENYEQDNPLFLKVSFARPHSPYDPPQRYLDMYKDANIPEPAIGEWADEFANKGNKNKNAAFGDFGKDHAVKSRRHYYANITFIDDQVGEIIDALKRKGIYDNTLVIFTADHGDMMGDHHHWRKTYAFEGSAKVPYLMKLPKNFETKVKRGAKLSQPVELRDILPTFLDAAGADIPKDMDGSSLLKLVSEKKPKWREYIDMEHATCYSHDNYWAALTDGEYKYIWHFSTGKERLFNLKNDPHEIKDLASVKKYQKRLKNWREKMIDHLSERGDEFVKNGKLQVLKRTVLHSPNHPTDNK